MSFHGHSLLKVEDLDSKNLEELFFRTEKFKNDYQNFGELKSLSHMNSKGPVLGLLFFEPSTRTKLSFEISALRMGLRCFGLPASMAGSSIVKGESFLETLETMVAMDPDLLVIRYSKSKELDSALRELPIPVLNGGSGTTSHPTQAFLDAFTIKESLGEVSGKKVLIVGDVLHSRVANSNLNLLKSIGAEVGVCGPDEFLPKEGAWSDVPHFTSIHEGVDWCDVCMGLRIQKERHNGKELEISEDDYRRFYRLDLNNLKSLSDKGLIMHPGPFVEGLDFSKEVLSDSRCVVREQVRNGVYVRAALMSMILGWEIK